MGIETPNFNSEFDGSVQEQLAAQEASPEEPEAEVTEQPDTVEGATESLEDGLEAYKAAVAQASSYEEIADLLAQHAAKHGYEEAGVFRVQADGEDVMVEDQIAKIRSGDPEYVYDTAAETRMKQLAAQEASPEEPEAEVTEQPDTVEGATESLEDGLEAYKAAVAQASSYEEIADLLAQHAAKHGYEEAGVFRVQADGEDVMVEDQIAKIRSGDPEYVYDTAAETRMKQLAAQEASPEEPEAEVTEQPDTVEGATESLEDGLEAYKAAVAQASSYEEIADLLAQHAAKHGYEEAGVFRVQADGEDVMVEDQIAKIRSGDPEYVYDTAAETRMKQLAAQGEA